MRLHELAQAGRSPSLPLEIQLKGETLVLERLLRVLPGQRYVAQATWRGQAVLAKLLVGKKAESHYQRELQGAGELIAQALPTPALLAQGFLPAEGGWLLFEFLADARSLQDEWREVAQQAVLSEAQERLLADALGTIAKMHLQGLWQADLHLDNFLRHQGVLQVIDGGAVQVETPGKPLSRERVLANLGMFFAQLPRQLEHCIEELLIHYLLVNGEHGLPLEALLAETEKVRRWRLRDYLKKIGRDCSLFAARISARGLQVVRRDQQAPLAAILAHPDHALAQAKMLKDGGSSTVVELTLANRALVLKRYNIKSVWHWLKRCWRPSRAWHSWVAGHRLRQLDIATPEPLAVIEKRYFGLRGRAYLITEHCAGEDLLSRFNPYQDTAPPEQELQALQDLLHALLRERISHGDLKGSNLFWSAGRWQLIDLDAMQQHRSDKAFARAYARDRARLLRNWPQSSALYQLLDQRLPKR